MLIPTTPGAELSLADQRQVLAMYPHRFTQQHRPDWAKTARPNGQPYKPHFTDDSDWLAHTLFVTTKSGRLDKRARHCQSQPTWPEGK